MALQTVAHYEFTNEKLTSWSAAMTSEFRCQSEMTDDRTTRVVRRHAGRFASTERDDDDDDYEAPRLTAMCVVRLDGQRACERASGVKINT